MRIFYPLMLALILTCQAWAAKPQSQVMPPPEVELNNMLFDYNGTWKDQEAYLETNIDNDSKKEIIISFMVTYYPQADDERNSDGMASTKKKKDEEIPVNENHAVYQIYDKDSQGNFKLVKTITGMDQLGKVEIIDVGPNEPPLLAIFNPSGSNFTDLSIYQYRQGGYRLIFNEGSSAGITIDTESSPIKIVLGAADQKKEKTETSVFTWDQNEKKFKSGPQG